MKRKVILFVLFIFVFVGAAISVKLGITQFSSIMIETNNRLFQNCVTKMNERYANDPSVIGRSFDIQGLCNCAVDLPSKPQNEMKYSDHAHCWEKHFRPNYIRLCQAELAPMIKEMNLDLDCSCMSQKIVEEGVAAHENQIKLSPQEEEDQMIKLTASCSKWSQPAD